MEYFNINVLILLYKRISFDSTTVQLGVMNAAWLFKQQGQAITIQQ